MKRNIVFLGLFATVLVLIAIGIYFYLPIAFFSNQNTKIPVFNESAFTKTSYALSVKGISYASESAALQVRSIVKGYLFNKVWLDIGDQSFSVSLPSKVQFGCVSASFKDVFVDLTQSKLATKETPFRSIQQNIKVGEDIGMVLDLDNAHLVTGVPLVVDYKCD